MLPSVAAQSTFNFYAYGSSGDLSAVPLFYENGHVMLSNLTSPANLTSVYFTGDTNGPSAWTVHSNTTTDPNPPFTSGYVTLEASSASSRTVFAKVDNKLQNPFYAAATETKGIYQLVWNPQNPNDEQLEAIVLRTVKPPDHKI
ncbi:hypothetical protein LMH87_003016 [Akanthomyces muscarius]|uniref:Uncharacterized protein n=1 Tax=Akanthomyces muscarius TaxID=2231603 RepID=A0A9W8UHL4_AKAMU|nr:hypothetical protein LMH87_003016 [Akanthomyces muscarius]KAJ4148551.1 hypothetical protein LMH87_003016 [Akanthomyces muscarius]